MERKTEVLESGKSDFAVSLKGIDLGLANWVAEKLCRESGIDFAASDYDHPMKGSPVLRVKGGSPKKSVLKALDEIKGDLKEFRKSLTK